VSKEITNFSSMYFSCTNNKNANTVRYQIVEEVSLINLKIFQWKGKGVGATSAHFVTDELWNYTIFQIWRKSNHISTSLTSHIENLVYNLQ
jgi:hypothetical protein